MARLILDISLITSVSVKMAFMMMAQKNAKVD